MMGLTRCASSRLSVFLALAFSPAAAAGDDRVVAAAAEMFPAAAIVGPAEGDPPSRPVRHGDRLIGYALSTAAVVGSVGYSGKPLDILVAINLDAHVTGATILAHQEPILVIGVDDADLTRFVRQIVGHDLRQPLIIESNGGDGVIDGISGATVSAQVIADAILRAGRAVATDRGLLAADRAALKLDAFTPASWQALHADGSLIEHSVTVGEMTAALDAVGRALLPPGVPPPDPTALFLKVTVGLASPARVGRNLLGAVVDNRIRADLAGDAHLIFVAADGMYSIKGTAWRRSGRFERLRVVQGTREITLAAENHIALTELHAEGAPMPREMALFVMPGAIGFDPARPWRLEIGVNGYGDAVPPPESWAAAEVAIAYTLPSLYRRAEIETAPLWQRNWHARRVEVAILGVFLLVLTGILVFQDQVAQRRRLYTWLRLGFLGVTLVWLGWIAQAQLSVVNVLTFASAIMTEFRWDSFLIEPLIFILWGYVAVALLFWGRGVYCGWLCPFGALQELAGRLARLARVPQIRLPFGLNERFWPIKYLIFLGLFALFLQDPILAMTGAEVEPFKTAIVFGFDRAWPFALYAIALVIIGLFIERFFCRYLCPLGGALAVPARLRMFEWLKRRWQCGTPCQQCCTSCPVQAIHPEGRINPNECIHCLHCQVYYFDDHICPPLIERRKRRETRAADRQARAQISSTPG